MSVLQYLLLLSYSSKIIQVLKVGFRIERGGKKESLVKAESCNCAKSKFVYELLKSHTVFGAIILELFCSSY